jgi:hypothetical protein
MKPVVKMLFGSHLYGLNTPSSDKDYKGIVLPTKEQILFGQANFAMSESTGDDKSKNSSEDVDTEMFSLQKFIDLACKGETVAIDMLHAPKSAIIESSEIWDWLVENRHLFYTKNMKAYLGYVRKQAAKYGVKGSRLAVMEEAINVAKESIESVVHEVVGDILEYLPIGEYSSIVETEHPSVGKQVFYEICGRKFQNTLKIPMFIDQLQKIYDSYGERAKLAQRNEGIDWKAISHALRAGYQLQYIYQDGEFSYPLPETQYLLDVKQGKLDFTTNVQLEIEALVDKVSRLADNSDYPNKVDRKYFNKMIYEIHEGIVLG